MSSVVGPGSRGGQRTPSAGDPAGRHRGTGTAHQDRGTRCRPARATGTGKVGHHGVADRVAAAATLVMALPTRPSPPSSPTSCERFAAQRGQEYFLCLLRLHNPRVHRLTDTHREGQLDQRRRKGCGTPRRPASVAARWWSSPVSCIYGPVRPQSYLDRSVSCRSEPSAARRLPADAGRRAGQPQRRVVHQGFVPKRRHGRDHPSYEEPSVRTSSSATRSTRFYYPSADGRRGPQSRIGADISGHALRRGAGDGTGHFDDRAGTRRTRLAQLENQEASGGAADCGCAPTMTSR